MTYQFFLITESRNSFVEVVIDLSSSIISCNFFNQQSVNIKSCTIDYGPNGSCDSLPFSSHSNYSTHSKIDIDLLTHPGFHNEKMYCYMVTASNGTHTVVVDGIFNTGMRKNLYAIKGLTLSYKK